MPSPGGFEWEPVCDLLYKDGYHATLVPGAGYSVYMSHPMEAADMIEAAAEPCLK